MQDGQQLGWEMVVMLQQSPEDVTTHRVVSFSEIYKAYVKWTMVFSGLSIRTRNVNSWSAHPLPFRKPHWFSRRSISALGLRQLRIAIIVTHIANTFLVKGTRIWLFQSLRMDLCSQIESNTTLSQ